MVSKSLILRATAKPPWDSLVHSKCVANGAMSKLVFVSGQLCYVDGRVLKARLFVLPDQDQDAEEESVDVDISVGRFVRYQFTPAFLRLRTVGAT